MHAPESDDELLHRLREGALRDAAESSRDMGEEAVDVLALARGEAAAETPAPDRTLGGYMQVHGRPPAFGGTDDEPYSVDLDVAPTDDPARPFAAFLIFIRWAATGAGIMDHVESDDVAFGASEEEARRGALELPLDQVKAALDAAIARRRADME